MNINTTGEPVDDSMFGLRDTSNYQLLGEETNRGILKLGPKPYLFSSVELGMKGFQQELFRRAEGYTIEQLEIVEVM